jgi:hypothetical protein
MISVDNLGERVIPGERVDSPTRPNSPPLDQQGEREFASAYVHGAREHEHRTGESSPNELERQKRIGTPDTTPNPRLGTPIPTSTPNPSSRRSDG